MKSVGTKKELSSKEREELLGALKARFEKNTNRHKGLQWAKVQSRMCGMEANTEKLWSLGEMEKTGGEPDVVGHDQKTGEYIFFDCSPESPKGRAGFCYDREALDSRKEHKPKNSATDLATAMGVELLTEEQYHELQKLGEFDTKTTTWVKTPADIRKLGGTGTIASWSATARNGASGASSSTTPGPRATPRSLTPSPHTELSPQNPSHRSNFASQSLPPYP